MADFFFILFIRILQNIKTEYYNYIILFWFYQGRKILLDRRATIEILIGDNKKLYINKCIYFWWLNWTIYYRRRFCLKIDFNAFPREVFVIFRSEKQQQLYIEF